ncbi:hypothetical protein JTB14_036756 [Gonioctena quinquepunctata]|nr:hypothetical protein JTB14_036756 [Gonioctena quinquepunctata]
MGNNSYASLTGSPVAVQTVFGYVIMGKVPILSSVSDSNVFFNLEEESSLNELMRKFWEIEQVPKNTSPNTEELECEKMYTSTFNRDSVGRFTVALPFKNSPNTLGDSKECAMTRLFSLERKLTKFSELRSGYNDIMRESIEQGHMHWRLLWRFSPDEPVQVYEFNRLAFGVKTSPYLALRTVKQLKKEEGYKYPFAAEVVSTDIYMDDLKWSKLKDEWSAVEKIQFSRYMGIVRTSPVMLVAFADASMDAYGAVVYMRTVTENGEITVNLLCAKSKVSPFKVVTIPRLEGAIPFQLMENYFWASGPTWMRLPVADWPIREQRFFDESGEEVDSIKYLVSTEETETHPLYDMVMRLSSYTTILRVTVWVLRFVKILTVKSFITLSDMNRAEVALVRIVQGKYFKSDIKLLNLGKKISNRLRKLNPFLQNGILMVGGRLENAPLTFVARHPIILPAPTRSALGVCTGVAPTGGNYNIIWKALVDKYQDARSLATSYLDQILGFKHIQGESAKNLESFLEKFDCAVQALKNLKLQDLADFILMHQALAKLDSETVKSFEMSVRGKGIPTYEDVIMFVKEQAKILNLNRNAVTGRGNYYDTRSRSTKSFYVTQENKSENREKTNTCIYCHKGWHFLSRCERFKRLTPSKRYTLVRENNWCYNCLSPKHGVRDCPSDRGAPQPGYSMNKQVHRTIPSEGSSTSEVVNTNTSTSETTNNNFHATAMKNRNNTVLLSTVVVNVLNGSGQGQKARFLLDSGSQVHLITHKCSKKLGLRISRCFSSVQGIGSNSNSVKGITDLIVASRYDSSKKYFMQAFYFGNVQLADDKFDEPTEIDGIIGAELFATVMGNNSYASLTGSPVAVQTVFGYVIMGKVPILSSVSDSNVFFNLEEESSLNELMRKFWEIEQVPKNTSPNTEELECEKMYTSTFNRDSVGRFTVALPFKNSPNTLGDSKECAMTRLFSLERKLTKFSELRSGYNDIMRESIEQGHMHWRLLWRFSPDEPVQVYEFNRLAFGVKTSPYLALRTVKQLKKEEGYKYPFAAEVVSTDIYMDDLVCSVPSEEGAHRFYLESVAMFAEGKFDLTKWSSSSLHLLEKIPFDRRLSQPVLFKTETKILGKIWNPEIDSFRFRFPVPGSSCTKRIISSTVARCYDPVELVAPFILYLKLLIKELWKL